MILAVCFVWLKTIGDTDEENDGEEKDEETTVVRRGSLLSAIGDQIKWIKSRMMSEEGRQARTRRRTIESSDPMNESRQNPLSRTAEIELPTTSVSLSIAEEAETSISLSIEAEAEATIREMHENPMKRNKSSTE